MQLIWNDTEQTSILVTIMAGESLGALVGPIEASVPVDHGNHDYQEIQHRGLTIKPFAPPPEFFAPLSRRQFYQILAIKGLITAEEALAAMQHGAIPEQFNRLLQSFTPEEQFAAKMLLSGAGEFQRDHPLAEKFAEDQGLSAQQIDAIWREGASL